MSQSQTPISPIEQFKKDLSTTQRDVNDLHNKVNLSSIQDRLEDIHNIVQGLVTRIDELRQKNYIFDPSLEKNAKDLQKRWVPIHNNTKVRLIQETIHLKADIKPIEQLLTKASANPRNVSISRQSLEQTKVGVENLSSKVTSSENLLRGMYDSFEKDLNNFTRTIRNIEWTINEFESSNIKLFMHEFLVMGVKAVWTKDGKEEKEDPEGVLYLTDQRLLFEQKEEVATKKFLFITKERELRQEVLIDIPIKYVESVQASKQGVFKNHDFLDINFSSGAQYNTAQFHIHNQDCEDWKGLINRIQSGDFIENRTEKLEQEVIDTIKNAPTICPQCGATLNVPLIRGMEEFSCEFCGAVIKL